MTTLILAQQKLFSSRAARILSLRAAADFILERERALVAFFLAGAVISLACYIGVLYVSFGLGSAARAEEVRMAALADEVREKEYELEARRARIPQEHEEFLSSMERVSAIRYIGAGEGYAASRSVPTP